MISLFFASVLAMFNTGNTPLLLYEVTPIEDTAQGPCSSQLVACSTLKT